MPYTAKEFDRLISAQESAQETTTEKAERVRKTQEAAAKEGERIKAEKALLGPRR